MTTEFGVDRSTAASGSSSAGAVLGFLRLLESGLGPDYVSLVAPALSASWTFTFPTSGGTSGYILTTNGSGTTSWTNPTTLTGLDHGGLVGLADDDHAQYALLAGRAGGQTLIGGTAASENLTLNSTAHATKGLVALQTAGGHITLGGAATASELRFLEPSGSGTNYTAFKAQAQAGDVTYTLPAADATVSGYPLTSNAAGSLSWAQLDHGIALTGLADDDHAQYALLAGRASGQTLTGGTAASENLTLNSTAHATKGLVALQTAGGHVTIGGGAAASEMRFLEPSGSGTNYTAFKAQAQAGDVTYTLPNADGTVGQVLSTNGIGGLSWAAGGGGGASTTITLASHGFVLGDVLYYTGATYAKADADAASTAEVVGVVSAVVDANTFTLLHVGQITGLSGLTAGTVYFLSGTAGALTATEPSTVGQISKPLLIAHSTSGGYFFNLRGSVVGSPASSFAIDRFSGDGSDTTFDLSVTPGSENNTQVFISGVYQQKDTYSLAGTTITFSTAPPTGTNNIEVCTVGALSIGTPSDGTVTRAKLSNVPVMGTEVASTSGTVVDFTGIPSGVRQLIVMLDVVSTNGTGNILIQLGDTGGIETTGYTSSGAIHRAAESVSTAGLLLGNSNSAIAAHSGAYVLYLQDETNNTWVGFGMADFGNSANFDLGTGKKSLSAVLDRVRVTTVSADTFDAGAINIQYI